MYDPPKMLKKINKILMHTSFENKVAFVCHKRGTELWPNEFYYGF